MVPAADILFGHPLPRRRVLYQNFANPNETYSMKALAIDDVKVEDPKPTFCVAVGWPGVALYALALTVAGAHLYIAAEFTFYFQDMQREGVWIFFVLAVVCVLLVIYHMFTPCSPAIPVVYIIDLLYVESRGNLCGWTKAEERLGGFHNKKKQPPENTVPATRDCLLFLADKRDPMVGPCKAVLSSTVLCK